ncbi:MAG TPA: hypothetical protein VEU33_44625 [Archangium sp.]|nr:hypothetical protein [Archangium sp.]
MSTTLVLLFPPGAIRRLGGGLLFLVCLVLQPGCSTGAFKGPLVPVSVVGHPPSARYAQSVDSATSGCWRNPGCYTALPGEEAVIPWLSRSVDAARTAVTVMRLLKDAELARVEAILVECAKTAHFQVNEREFGKGKIPTREQCNEVVRQERGRDVTRAMELGNKKHEEALACVQRELGVSFPDNFTVQPHYKYDPQTGRWRMLDPKHVAQWIRDELFDLLLGTLAPDVVIHDSGNPDKVQRVYDYKFPCVSNRKHRPMWRDYPEGHPHHPKNQGEMYREALGGEDPALVTPQLGVHR